MIHPAIQVEKIFRTKFLQTTRGGDEIVHEDNALPRKFQPCRERRGVQDPGNVRGVKAAVHDGTGDAETGGDNVAIRNGRNSGVRESFNQVFETGKLASGIALFKDELQSPAVIEVGREVAFCSADVARDDHEASRLSGKLCQLFRSVLLCKLEHAMIIIAQRKSGGRMLIKDESDFGM